MRTTARAPLLLALAILLAGTGLWLALGGGGGGEGVEVATGAPTGDAVATVHGGPHLDEARDPGLGLDRTEPGEGAGFEVERSAIDAVQAVGRADGIWLEGRLVDAEGAPLPEVAVRLSLLPASREVVPPDRLAENEPILLSPFLQTDATGRFRTNAEGASNFHGRTLLRAESVALLLEEVLGLESEGERRGEVALTVPLAFEVGQDCGDVVLAEPELVVAGRVRDHRGRPVRSARLLLLGGDRGDPGAFGRFPAQVTGPDGAFRFEGRAPAGSLFLRAEKQGSHHLAGAEFRVGSAEHRVELSPSAGLVLELDGPPPARDHSHLELRDAWGELVRSRLLRRRVTELWDLRPGTYELTIRRASRARPVVRVAGLVAPPGGRVDDPRLDDLDLSAGMEAVALEVVDDEGAPVAGYVVSLVEDGTWSDLELDDEGRVELGELPATIEVEHPDFAPRRVAVPKDPDALRVELDRGLAVSLELPDGLVTEGWRPVLWTARVRPLGAGGPHREQEVTAGVVGSADWPWGGLGSSVLSGPIDLESFDADSPMFYGDRGDRGEELAPGGGATLDVRLPGPGPFEVVLSGRFQRDGASLEAEVAHLRLTARDGEPLVPLPLPPFDPATLRASR